MNLNKVQLIGRLTKDPELKALQSGAKVAKFGLATNHTYKKDDGTKVENVSFHNIVVFGKSAEIIAQYSKKGAELYVDGRIEYRSWDKKEGGKGYATEIVVDNFQLGAKAKGTAIEEKKEDKEIEYPTEEINPEDIPF